MTEVHARSLDVYYRGRATPLRARSWRGAFATPTHGPLQRLHSQPGRALNLNAEVTRNEPGLFFATFHSSRSHSLLVFSFSRSRLSLCARLRVG